MESCIGSVVAVDCGDDGYYQGILTDLDVNSESKCVFLSNVFREGVPCGKMMRLDAVNIKALKVLRTPESTVASPPKPKESVSSKPTVKNTSSQNVIKKLDLSPSTSIQKPTQGSRWVSRPLMALGIKSSSSSSDIETRSSRENIPKIHKKKQKSSKARESQVAAAVHTTEATPTPMFKIYEPQVPKPQKLAAPAWAIRSARKGQGPCGIPILDVQNGYGRISSQNAHLDNIDFDELASDFDFATNLQQFDRDKIGADDDEVYETVEKPKMSRNFKHTENIVDDPSRVTSWTNVTAQNGYSADESKCLQ